MIEWLGLDNRPLDHDLNTCVKCQNEQYERPHPLDKGGKYAWQCEKCGTVNENGKEHLLATLKPHEIQEGKRAWFGPKRGIIN